MIRLYYNLAPNPMKISLLLEETGLPYEIVPVDTRKGEQHLPAFRAINPNGKLPAIIDTDGGKETRVFDSTAILIYLGEKTGKLMGASADRGELLSWLMFIGIQVLFICAPEYAGYTEGLGEFLPITVAAADIVPIVKRMLRIEPTV